MIFSGREGGTEGFEGDFGITAALPDAWPVSPGQRPSVDHGHFIC
jgi:hypothetical protein